jgi:hypothetical protein
LPRALRPELAAPLGASIPKCPAFDQYTLPFRAAIPHGLSRAVAIVSAAPPPFGARWMERSAAVLKVSFTAQ